MNIILQTFHPTTETSLLPVISEYSRRSCQDEEGNDVIVRYLERRTLLITGRRRPFILSSELGYNKQIVLSSLESMIQNFAIRQAREVEPSLIAMHAAVQTQLSLMLADAPDEPMIYKPLEGSNWTRLFRLNRMVVRPFGPDAFTVSISGSLRAFELDRMPSYRALSYTWAWPYEANTIGGSQEKIEMFSSITCNGGVLHLTENLFQALCYIGSAGITGWLWIDAICINQADGKEKADLICQMDTIYSHASEVVGWLGFVHIFTRDFIWGTTDFIDKFQKHPYFTRSGYDWPTDSLHDKEVDRFFEVDSLAACLSRVYFFYISCRWFRRAWVTQEIVLGKRVRLFCGEFEVSWVRLQAFATIMQRTGWLSYMVSKCGSVVDTYDNRGWLYELITWKNISQRLSRILTATEPQDMQPNLTELEIFSHPPASVGRYLTCFHDLISSTSNFRCSEPLDHVFSAIGLAGPEYKATIIRLLNMDYTMNRRDFCVEIATSIFSSANYLDFLIGAGIQEDFEGGPDEMLPSWVQNYTSPPKYSAFSNINVLAVNAGLCNESAPSFKIQGLELVCDGACFDTVEAFLDIHTIPRIHFLEFCADFPLIINNRPRLEVLWRTIILDSTFDGQTPASSDYGVSFLAAIASEDAPDLAKQETTDCRAAAYFTALEGYLDMLNSKEVLGVDAITSAGMRQYVELLKSARKKEEQLPQSVLDINRKALPYTRSEGNPRGVDRLFRTEKGHMGISRGPCQKGDQVWALRSAHVPFVLRKKERSSPASFELVGTCFVLDKMQGEIIGSIEEVKAVRLV